MSEVVCSFVKPRSKRKYRKSIKQFQKHNMKEFFKNIDLMNVLFIIAELANFGGIVTGFINDNQSAVLWAITSTLWCASAAVWYNRYKDGE